MEVDEPGFEHLLPREAERDFEVGDVVLAFHGSLLYEAKILGRGEGSPPESYTVHYQGWKMSWDETVPRNRVVEHNDENLRIAHELLRSAKSRQKRDAAERSRAQNVESGDDPRGGSKKRGPGDADTVGGSREDDVEDVANGTSDAPKKETKDPISAFDLPSPLKRYLVDDWEFITKDRKLVPLPREHSVAHVLKEWLKTRRGGPDEASEEIVESLLEYFDALLPTLLLYGFERPQFSDYFDKRATNASEAPPSNVYGVEHLLRLFVKIPCLLADAKVEPEMRKRIGEKIGEIARFIQKNSRSILLTDYEPATSQYISTAEGLGLA